MKKEFIIKQVNKDRDLYLVDTYYQKMDETHFAYFDLDSDDAMRFASMKAAVKLFWRMFLLDDACTEYWEFSGHNTFHNSPYYFRIVQVEPETEKELEVYDYERIKSYRATIK